MDAANLIGSGTAKGVRNLFAFTRESTAGVGGSLVGYPISYSWLVSYPSPAGYSVSYYVRYPSPVPVGYSSSVPVNYSLSAPVGYPRPDDPVGHSNILDYTNSAT